MSSVENNEYIYVYRSLLKASVAFRGFIITAKPISYEGVKANTTLSGGLQLNYIGLSTQSD